MRKFTYISSESMTIYDIAKLNGSFTEGLLIERGYPIEVIREAISIGLLRPNRMGVLETIRPDYRANKLPKTKVVEASNDTFKRDQAAVLDNGKEFFNTALRLIDSYAPQFGQLKMEQDRKYLLWALFGQIGQENLRKFGLNISLMNGSNQVLLYDGEQCIYNSDNEGNLANPQAFRDWLANLIVQKRMLKVQSDPAMPPSAKPAGEAFVYDFEIGLLTERAQWKCSENGCKVKPFRSRFSLAMHRYYHHDVATGTKNQDARVIQAKEKDPIKAEAVTEAYAAGQTVVKMINGVAVQFQVHAVNGNTLTLVSTDGKNQTVQANASDPDLALAPMTDDEKRNAAQANQKIQNAPSAPAPTASKGMTSTSQGSSAMGEGVPPPHLEDPTTTLLPPREHPPKKFKIVSVSENANSFGLHGYILVAQDGEAWEVGRSIGPWHSKWEVGNVVTVPLDKKTAAPIFVGCEIPRRLPDPPREAVAELWNLPPTGEHSMAFPNGMPQMAGMGGGPAKPEHADAQGG